jgi:hypothetical protein
VGGRPFGDTAQGEILRTLEQTQHKALCAMFSVSQGTGAIRLLGGTGDTTHFVNTESNSFITTSRLSLLWACHRAYILIIVNRILSLHLRSFTTNNMAIDVLRHNVMQCDVM